MKFELIFNMDNDAFHPEVYQEVARIMKEIVTDCENYILDDKNIRDINGNTIGKLIINEES